MGLFDNEAKQKKNNLIALQNIVLEINEKKLQVSEEFLEKMTKIYISKYLKVINEQMADMGKLSNIGLLFKKYDYIISNIDELIKIEEYHKFNKPTPSSYKEQLTNELDSYINALIAREWKKIKQPTGSLREDPKLEQKYIAFFNEFDLYMSRMPETSKITLKKLHDSVFPPEPETNDEPSAIKTVSSELPNLADEFVEEEFETISIPEEDNGSAEQ